MSIARVPTRGEIGESLPPRALWPTPFRGRSLDPLGDSYRFVTADVELVGTVEV